MVKGAVSGRGHGRFWFGRGRVVIAHRFTFALAFGVDALDQPVGILIYAGSESPLSQSARLAVRAD